MTDPKRNTTINAAHIDLVNTNHQLLLQQEHTRGIARHLLNAAAALESSAAAQPSGEDCMVPPPSQQLPENPYKPFFDYSAAVAALADLKKARLDVYNAQQRVALARGRYSINTL